MNQAQLFNNLQLALSKNADKVGLLFDKISAGCHLNYNEQMRLLSLSKERAIIVDEINSIGIFRL